MIGFGAGSLVRTGLNRANQPNPNHTVRWFGSVLSLGEPNQRTALPGLR